LDYFKRTTTLDRYRTKIVFNTIQREREA